MVYWKSRLRFFVIKENGKPQETRGRFNVGTSILNFHQMSKGDKPLVIGSWIQWCPAVAIIRVVWQHSSNARHDGIQQSSFL